MSLWLWQQEKEGVVAESHVDLDALQAWSLRQLLGAQIARQTSTEAREPSHGSTTKACGASLIRQALCACVSLS